MSSVTKGVVLGLVKTIVRVIVRAITPVVEEELEKFLVDFHRRCLSTENPWDDMLSGFLLDIFDIDFKE